MKDLVRKNIQQLKPYSSARNEYSGKVANVFLDANENPYNAPLNRYPDPLQQELKELLAPLKGVQPENIFLGNGSDEAIDLLFRVFCEPKEDNVVAISPTYGMYEVCANINDVEYRPVALDADFQMDADEVLKACDENTKLIFLCSPNNPSGNDIARGEIEKILNGFDGIVVIDEAYSDFSKQKPFRLELAKCPRVVVLNTFSKAWGCAAIRLGMAFASEEIIGYFNKVKYPYNINYLTQKKAIEVLKNNVQDTHLRINLILEERETVMAAFAQLPICKKVYPSAANFFLAKVTDANGIYNYLIDKGIVVRNRNKIALCGDCLRITIGTKNENTPLLCALRQYN